MDWVYLASSILAIMALNNRKYGNHTIRFYKDHVVVPKLLIYGLSEEIIDYSEIDELDYGLW